VTQLAQLSSTLAEQSNNLAQILHVAPNALANFYNIEDPRYGAFVGQLGLGNLQASGAQLGCGLFAGLLGVTGQSSQSVLDQFRTDCQQLVAPLDTLLGLSNGVLPGGQLPIVGSGSTTDGGANGSPPKSSGSGDLSALLPGLLSSDPVTGLLGLLLPGVGG